VTKYHINRARRIQTPALEVRGYNLETSEFQSVNTSAIPQSGLAFFPIKLQGPNYGSVQNVEVDNLLAVLQKMYL